MVTDQSSAIYSFVRLFHFHCVHDTDYLSLENFLGKRLEDPAPSPNKRYESQKNKRKTYVCGHRQLDPVCVQKWDHLESEKTTQGQAVPLDEM